MNRRAGLTLLEILLVLAILLVISSMVLPNYLGRQQRAMINATRSSISGLEQTLKLYAIDHDAEFPQGSGQNIFQDLIQPRRDAKGNVVAPYLDVIPTDAWGRTLYYEYPSSKFRGALKPAIWSSGPDETNDDGAGDDINNWAELAR